MSSSRRQETHAKKDKQKKLRVNIVLNNKDDPMDDTTNTCSCDCGVRSQFIVPRFQFSVLNLLTFQISGFQFPQRHAGVTDTTTPADGTRRIAVFLSLW